VIEPQAMTPAQLAMRERIAQAAEQRVLAFVVLLESGEWAYVQRMHFTFALMVGCDETGYRTRFCFATLSDAMTALLTWDGRGDPPGDWIKEKGRVERENPLRYLRGIPIVSEIERV